MPKVALKNSINTSRSYSFFALEHLSRKLKGKLDNLDTFKKTVKNTITQEPFTPPLGFLERGGYWTWEEK